MAQYKFPTDLKEVKEASEKVLAALSGLNLEESELFDIRLCFEEAFINAVKYGNEFNKKLTVDVDVNIDDNFLEIAVRDYGQGFDPKDNEDPTIDKNITKTSGRGLFLIQKLMDTVVYEDDTKCLRMLKNIKK